MCMIESADYTWDDVERETCVSDGSTKCLECGRVIRLDESFEYLIGTHGDEVDIVKTCTHCLIAGQWLNKECGGHLSGFVGEDLEEHWAEGEYGFGLGRLIAGMRRKWARRSGDLMAIPAIPKTTPMEAI